MKNKRQKGKQFTNLDLDSLVPLLEDWLRTQTQLPQLIEKPLLKRFLYAVNGDVQSAKRLLELNYTLRNKHAHIFLNRDPNDVSTHQLLQVADLVPLPGLTPDNKHKLLLYRLIDFDADKFDFVEGVKVFFMMADCRFAIEDEADELAEGEVPIFDMAGFSLRHLTKTVFSALRVYMKFVQEAHPVRLKAIHVLNCPSFLDKVLMLVRPLIKSEVFKLINFHLPNANTPYEFMPREMFPEEYGGQAGKMSDLKAKWLQLLQEKRTYLIDPNRWKMNTVSKKDSSSGISMTPKISNTPTESLTHNFMSLDID